MVEVCGRDSVDQLTTNIFVDLELAHMGNLQSKRWILAKGWLFCGLGVLSAGLLVWQHPDFATTALLAIAIWSFCRFYYFAFYVIQHYVDSRYRFAGLLDFLRYCLTGKCVDRLDAGRDEVRDTD